MILYIIVILVIVILIILKYKSNNKFTNKTNKNIDKIYVINLKKNTDRWESISELAKKANVNITRFDAIYGKELDDNHPDIIKYFIKNHKLNKGQIGCALSHVKIWEDAIKNNYKNIIVFEDDAVIPEDFWGRFNKYYNALPKDWDMLLLGGVQLGGTRFNDNLLKPDKRSGNLGTSSFLLNIKFIKKVMSELKFTTTVDDYIRDKYYYDNNFNIYIVDKTINNINYEFNSDIGVGVPGKNYDIKIYDKFTNKLSNKK
jgi:GR25 family glycosyltransferase involved in LPS biosynthesis